METVNYLMGLPKRVAIIQTAILSGVGILLLIPQFVSWAKSFKYGVFHSEKPESLNIHD